MKKTLVLFFFLTCSITTLLAQTSKLSDKELEAAFDKLLNEQFKADGPGATALVSRNGKIIYEKAVGLANLETGTPMQVNNIFRIGSITKQFTAVSILQLIEKGKLGLTDSITKFIPGYPMQGNMITIEHLLTHTSGIRSYTDMDEFDGQFMRKDMKPEELIKVFRDKPMDFKTGTKWNYNNSGYILLGYIIEKISGKTYAEYIEENIFKPLGMKNSSYDRNNAVIKNRAAGYQPAKEGVENAAYLSMTLPYAAGSLLSTVEDLNTWTNAVMNYKLVKKETLQKAFTGYKLLNGRDTYYGYGWFMGDLKGSRTIEHSGGINGYLSNGIYLPAEQVYVAVLSNCTCNPPNDVSTKMAALAIGRSFDNPTAIEADSMQLKKYEGVYQNDDGEQRTITADGKKLFSQRGGSSKYNLMPYDKDKFFFEKSISDIQFVWSGDKVSGLNFKTGSQQNQFWTKTDKPIPAAVKEVVVDARSLDDLVGEYELSPQFSITIRKRDNKLTAQATGQQEFDLFARSEDVFFLKVVDAQIEFTKTNGKVTGMILHQGGADVPGKKK